jgi:hypothetical protein
MPGSKVVDHSTHNSKIKGLNPATGIENERENRKKLFSIEGFKEDCCLSFEFDS